MSEIEITKHPSSARILVKEPSEIAVKAIEILKENGYQIVLDESEVEAKEVQGLFIRTATKLNKEILDKYPELEFILRAGVGLDNIDLNECKKRNIKIYHAPGANSSAVAEYVLGMAIYMSRGIERQRKSLKQGTWRDMSEIGTSIFSKTVGLVGCGNIGKSIAKMLSALGTTCYGYDPYLSSEDLAKCCIQKSELTDLLSIADIVVILVPLNDETYRLIDREKLAVVKKGSILINISRGEVLNENDIIDAVVKGHIGGVVLDVCEGEPNINAKLLETENIIVTPHIAGVDQITNTEIAVTAVKNFLKGHAYENV